VTSTELPCWLDCQWSLADLRLRSGVAPRVGGRPGKLDLHVRHVTDERCSTGGEWRVQMLAL